MNRYKTLIVERVGGEKNVGLVTFNRPDVLNAFNKQQSTDLCDILSRLNDDPQIAVIVLTGAGKAFSAGMDIKESLERLKQHPFERVNDNVIEIERVQKPVIAAVNGYAFGAGCEVAMKCDIIWASDQAQFAQPEVKIGLVPGMGGTQRLARRIGKPLALELCLTGRAMSAQEAKSSGLIARVLPHENLLNETIKLADEIARQSRGVVKLIKESVNRSQELSLSEGLLFERRVHELGMMLPDSREGLAAFVQKRKPNWSKI